MTTNTTSSYLKNFPFPTLRKNQEYVLNEIEKGFEEGKDFIIYEAPTGCGKSPIAIAAGLTLGSSYILTSTKNLQSQYKQDFGWVQMAKGRNNFQCPMLPSDAPYTTADHAPCRMSTPR
jgi:ATP-dependent DNA helicase DinG